MRYATPMPAQLIAAGVDVVAVSKRLGHANPTVTLRVYAHLYAPKDDASGRDCCVIVDPIDSFCQFPTFFPPEGTRFDVLPRMVHQNTATPSRRSLAAIASSPARLVRRTIAAGLCKRRATRSPSKLIDRSCATLCTTRATKWRWYK